jgi:hypothetical protein
VYLLRYLFEKKKKYNLARFLPVASMFFKEKIGHLADPLRHLLG